MITSRELRLRATRVLALLLTVDGEGSGLDADLLRGKHAPLILSDQTNRVTLVGDGVSHDTHTFSVAANTLGTDRSLRVKASFRTTTGSGSRTVSFSYGGAGDASSIGQPFALFEGEAVANGATNAQTMVFATTSGGRGGNGAMAVDTTAAQTIKLALNVAVGTTVVCDRFQVLLERD